MGNTQCVSTLVIHRQIASLMTQGTNLRVATLEGLSQKFCKEFYRKRSSLVKYQNMAANEGVVECLAEVLQDFLTPEQEESVLVQLKWLCLNNKNVSIVVYTDERLMARIRAILVSTGQDDFFLDEEECRNAAAIQLLNTIARNLWSLHKDLADTYLPLIEKILERTDLSSEVQNQAVTFVCILSFNTDSRERLSAVVNSLVRYIDVPLADPNSRLLDEAGVEFDPESGTLAVVTSGMALANVCPTAELRMRVPDHIMTRIIHTMLDALDSTIRGEDYPKGSNRYFSDWTLVASIANIGEDLRNKKMLWEAGLVGLLSVGLQNPKANPELQKCALMMAQDLSQFASKSLAPVTMKASMNAHTLLGLALTNIVQKNDSFLETKAMKFKEGSMFETNLKARMSVSQYIDRIQEFSACSQECFLIAPVLIGRLEHAYGLPILQSRTIHRVVLLAIMLAAKTHDDEYLNNKCFARVGGIKLQELNALEIEFITQLDHRLTVPEADYEGCRQALELIALGGQILTPRTTHLAMNELTNQVGGGLVVPWPGLISRPINTSRKTPRQTQFLISLTS